MFDIEVVGVKSHGAYPDEGIDAIVAASQIVTAVQSIVSRKYRLHGSLRDYDRQISRRQRGKCHRR